MIDPQLRKFANPRQIEVLDAIHNYGSERKAAVALGICRGTLSGHIATLKENAARKGYAPTSNVNVPIPEGYNLKGTSTLYNKDGEVTAQWVKTTVDWQRQEQLLLNAVESLSKKLPRREPVKAPKINKGPKLCNVLTLTDSHVGMLAWHREAGADWDLEIAEKTLTDCMFALMDQCPPARTAVIAQLGDFMHYDGLEAVTPTSNHILDSDGRFAKMVQVGITILRNVIDRALETHEKVVLLMAEGNHDIASSVWLRTMFKALYEKEPRIEVLDTPLPYYLYEHGKVMLAWHHGHLSKNDKLPLLFATQFPQAWGRTEFRYAHTGHRHHLEIKEHSGMTVIQHTTLAARDAYAARGGWHSLRNITGYTYHMEHGQVGTVTVTPEMVFS